MMLQIEGVCCGCQYDGYEETDCPKREDGIHCVCWWEGPDPTQEEHGKDLLRQM